MKLNFSMENSFLNGDKRGLSLDLMLSYSFIPRSFLNRTGFMKNFIVVFWQGMYGGSFNKAR